MTEHVSRPVGLSPISPSGLFSRLILDAAGAPEQLQLVVFGLPGPQGSKKYVGTSKAGRGILVESSKKVKPWRQAVVDEFNSLMNGLYVPRPLFDGPLRAEFHFTLPKPASAPKRRTTWPDKKPDGSKLQRSTEDALSDVGAWKDDARLVEWFGRKYFPGEGGEALHVPGCIVRVCRLGVPLSIGRSFDAGAFGRKP